MNRIDSKFSECREAGRKAMIVHVTAGDPDEKTSFRILSETARSGADVIEFGLPFSDPTADGPVVQRASQRAIASGMNIPRAFALLARFRKSYATPVLLSSYANPIFRYGYEAFARDAAAAGADGLIAIDIPPEESDELEEALARHGLLLVRPVSSTTTERRLSLISRGAGGFFPVIAAGDCPAPHIKELVSEFRPRLSLPLCLERGRAMDGELFQFLSIFDGIVDETSVASLSESLSGDELVTALGTQMTALRKRL